MTSEFQTLVQGQSIDSITPQQILAAGSPVFLDIQTNADIGAINKLIESYGKIHTPTRGQCIPLSGLISIADGAVEILAPSNNEIRKIIAISVTNAGAAPIVGALTVGGVQFADFAVNPTSTTQVTIDGLFASKLLIIGIEVTSGTAAELTTKIASLLVVQ